MTDQLDVHSGKGQNPHPVLPTPPSDDEKMLYVERKLWLLLPFTFLSMAGLVVSQVRFSLEEPVLYGWLIVVAMMVIYWAISMSVNLATRDFNLEQHNELMRNYALEHYPSIDVFLPVCGEPLAVMRNAWTYIDGLAWEGLLNIIVLDDQRNSEVEALAREFGFEYMARGNNVLQKAGNLLFGFRRTSGEFIVIFDADFCPRADMLHELMPYFESDANLGIVQSPQYFRVDKSQVWLERGAGAVQELFYRMVQTSREQHGASICVGTNAIYRRTALEANNGPTQIGHSEDVHTGFDLRCLGWGLTYVPLAYATGICPSVRSSFIPQQYRWCAGSMSLLLSRKFWQAKMPVRARFSYLSGFLYYITTALMTIAGPLVPLVLLVVYPELVRLENYWLLLPSVLYAFVLFPLWHRHSYGLAAFAVRMIYGWAHLFALTDIVMKRRVAWVPTGTSDSASQGGAATKAKLRTRFKVCVAVWGWGTATVWVFMGLYRLSQNDWWDFLPVVLMGAVYGAIVTLASQPGIRSDRGSALVNDDQGDVDVVKLSSIITGLRNDQLETDEIPIVPLVIKREEGEAMPG